mgnify:CR=1 FL=1
MSLVLTSKTAYIYDTFSRDPKKTIPILVKRLLLAGYNVKFDKTRDAEQRAFYKNKLVTNCGAQTLAWLMSVQELGIRTAMKI